MSYPSISYLFVGMVILERQEEELDLVRAVEKVMVGSRVEHGMEMVQEVLLVEISWEMKQQE